MSSFLGHSLAAATLYVAAKPPARPVLWAIWLIAVASAPDIDYVIPGLRLPGETLIRITHSFVGCQVVPWLTCLVLGFAGLRGRELATRSVQVMAAGLSHVVLDVLVGVTPAPLLWPFNLETFKLSFGILPSAGHLDWNNWMLLRNTVIELGALGPVFLIVFALKKASVPLQLLVIPPLALVSCFSMGIAFLLDR